MHFNYLMEDKFETSERQQDQQQIKNSMNQVKEMSNSSEKNVRKSKKESLKVKKILKKDTSGLENSSISNNEMFNNGKSQEESPNVKVIQSKEQKEKLEERWTDQPFQYSLDKQLIRPPYISVSHNNHIAGTLGHGTALFKRPIIQGCYFLEVQIKDDLKTQQKTANNSAVRVGLSHYTFNPSFPLGYGESIAYKSSDGSLIRSGSKLEKYDSSRVGDVIGICVKIGAPCKYPDPEKINPNSSVSFYKNGKLLGNWGGLKQKFYSIGVSLYNYAQVEVLRGSSSKFKMMPQAVPYFNSLSEKIPYQNLESKKIFKL